MGFPSRARLCQASRMREACCLWLSAADRAHVAAIAADRNSPRKHVRRAQIVLLAADRASTVEIMRWTGKAKAHRVAGRRATSRLGSTGSCTTGPGLGASRGSRPSWSRVCWPARSCRRRARPPIGRCAPWRPRAGIAPASVQRIWAAHGLQPHRVRTFKLSSDPAFAAKPHDAAGLTLPGRTGSPHRAPCAGRSAASDPARASGAVG